MSKDYQPAPYRCKHDCKHDKYMDRIATLEAELAAAQHQVKGALVMYDALVVKLEAKEAELAAMKARGIGWRRYV